MNTGKVKFFNETKGYGFIIPDDVSQSEIFFHCTKVTGKVSADTLVQYDVETSKKGPVAINVKQAF
jgi:CspA family cold shock protein